jgi:hypothetical protein
MISVKGSESDLYESHKADINKRLKEKDICQLTFE